MLAWATARRLAGLLGGLALVIALGIGTTLAAFTAAWRTDRAYPDYIEQAEVGEVVVNPSLLTDRIIDVIATTPGVVDVVVTPFCWPRPITEPPGIGPRSREESPSRCAPRPTAAM